MDYNKNCNEAIDAIENIKDDLQNKIQNYPDPTPELGAPNDNELWVLDNDNHDETILHNMS